VWRQQGSTWTSVAKVSDSVTFQTDVVTNIGLAGSAANPYIAYYSEGTFLQKENAVVVATPQDGDWKPIPSRNSPTCGVRKLKSNPQGMGYWARSRFIATPNTLYFLCNTFNIMVSSTWTLNVYSYQLPAATTGS
jgi:hypothetical protein